MFADACPKTIPEAIRVATKIMEELSENPRLSVERLDDIYLEIIDVKGTGTHYMED